MYGGSCTLRGSLLMNDGSVAAVSADDAGTPYPGSVTPAMTVADSSDHVYVTDARMPPGDAPGLL